MKAPFPWFGGKRRVADIVWARFGNVCNYVEPFAGSLAVLLERPHQPNIETVNDINCYLANFWRAVSAEPQAVAEWSDWPVNEADLHARHTWLVGQAQFRERMKTDPDYFDVKIAGWWVWGISQWIGSGWCDKATWCRFDMSKPRGIHRKRMNLRRGGVGVHRKLPHLYGHNGASGRGVHRSKPDISGCRGASGRGVHGAEIGAGVYGYFEALAARLRRVRVCCGDWLRVLGPSPTIAIGETAVFLDPPYGVEDRDEVYTDDSREISKKVREWAIQNGSEPLMRIALCGYEGEHEMPDNWRCVSWLPQGGYGRKRGKENRQRERIWFSPHCLVPENSTPMLPLEAAGSQEVTHA